MDLQLEATSLILLAKEGLVQQVNLYTDGVDYLVLRNTSITPSSLSTGFVNITLSGTEVYHYNTDGTRVTTYNDPYLTLSFSPNETDEARAAQISMTFEVYELIYDEDEPQKQFYLNPLGEVTLALKVDQAIPEPQVDDVDTDAITSGGFLFELIGSIAFPQLQQLLESVQQGATQEIEDLMNDLAEINQEIAEGGLSPKAMARLLEKKEKLLVKIAEKREELMGLAQKITQQVTQQVQDIISGASNFGKEVLNNIKNIGEQSAILVAGVPKLVVNATTCILEPMTSVATCAVGPVATITNPGQIAGTILRLGQQAKALKGPISSIKQSADFLQLTGPIGQKYGLDTLLAPIDVIDSLISKIPG